MEENKPFTIEDYMQTLLRIGFSRESALEHALKYQEKRLALTIPMQLRQLEEAAYACGIHGDQIRDQERKELESHEIDRISRAFESKLRTQMGTM